MFHLNGWSKSRFDKQYAQKIFRHKFFAYQYPEDQDYFSAPQNRNSQTITDPIETNQHTNYELIYSRIATAEKLNDRFLNCQSKITSDLNKSFMGKVYTLVEVLSPWSPTSNVGQSIINNFSQAYYGGGSTSDLANFEEALKTVNEVLARITQNGETSWIGNLNSILAVVIDNKIHLAQTGHAEAYIFRDGKTNHITEGLAKNNFEPHPLKTYSNVTSGELKIRDKILIANPDLFKYLDLESIRQTITLNTVQEGALQLAKALKKKKIRSVNAFILELSTLQEVSRQPITETPDTIYLDKPIESYSALAQRTFQQFVLPLLKTVGQITKKTGKNSLEFTKKYLKTVNKKHETHELVKKKDLFDDEFLNPSRNEGLLNDEEIQYSPDLKVHYYEEETKRLQSTKFNFHQVLIICSQTFSFIRELFSNHKRRPYLFALAAIIIFVFIGSIIGKNSGKNNSLSAVESQSILSQAQKIQKDAESALSKSKTDEAKNLFVQAIEKAMQIKDKPVVDKDATKVINESFVELDKLTSTTRFTNLTPVVSSDNPIKASFIVSSRSWLITNNEILKGSIDGTKPQKAATIAQNMGNVQSAFMANQKIYIYTSTQKLLEFDPNTEKINLAKLSEGSWETANSLGYYNNNLYLLDGIVGQVYKHSMADDGFSKGETYINSPAIDAKDSVSITIDGSIYILKNNGQVLKLQKGKLQDFSLQNIPTPYSKIGKPLKIYTDQDAPSIYILDNDNKRILEFDKDGSFVHQYGLPQDFNDIKDFSVSYKSKKIWITNSNSVYAIDL